MLKKFLAAVSTIALALGMVVLTAGPASAHHSDVSATFACTGPNAGTITWSVQNWNGGKTGKVISSTSNIVPAGTQFASNEKKTFTQNITAAGTYNLSVTMRWLEGGNPNNDSNWKNEATNSGSITIKASDFSPCAPDDTNKKVTVCHANNGNGFSIDSVSASSIINNTPNGHGTHGSDIIPPFSYVKQGVEGSYAGKNWTSYGQWVYNNGCSTDVVPASASIAQPVCTGAGTWGVGSYTVPAAGVGFKYQVRINSNSPNAWADKAAGTYDAAVGTDVEIRAVALQGYELKGNDNQYYWNAEIKKPAGDCIVTVTATKPASTDAVCVADGQIGNGTITIPAITGVKYQYYSGNSWKDIAAGTHQYPAGTDIWFRALALPGYNLQGIDDWYVWEVDVNGPNSSKCVDPVDPSFTDSICVPTGTGSTTASYTIPNDTGVKYDVRINGGSWTPKNAGTFQVAVGSTVEVRASATGQYILVNYNGPWSHTFTNPGDCLDDAPVANPNFSDAVCNAQGTGTTPGSFTVFPSANVTYTVKVNNVVVPTQPNTPIATQPGDVVVVTAVAANGYKLVGYPANGWSHTFTDPGPCLDDAPVTAPTFVDEKCHPYETGTVDGYYFIPAAANVTFEVRVNGGAWEPASTNVQVKVNADDVIEIRATAANGYQLVNYTGPWSHTFEGAGECLDEVTPAAPTFTEAVCTEEPGQSTDNGYTIPAAQAGVEWTVTIDGQPGDNQPGSHKVAVGEEVVITATPADGYTFPEGDWSYEFTAVDPGDCLEEAPVATPTAQPEVCVEDEETQIGEILDGAITIPASAHVTYEIDGTEYAAGVHAFPAGTYTVTAVADPGYKLVGYPQGGWELEVEAAGICGQLPEHPIVKPVVAFSQFTCTTDGSFTLSTEERIPGAVIWTVNGNPVAEGTTTVTTAGTVKIVAVPAEGYGFNLPEGQEPRLEWSFDFAGHGICGDLPTLALTGGTAAGGLAISSLLVIAGALTIALRRRQVTTEV